MKEASKESAMFKLVEKLDNPDDAGLRNFANGLLRDIKAVENAIRLPWSNGTVEGHLNRIKSIKRQMYGRASFELLRRKVILSQNG